MSIQVETKDCTSISDAELAEMADLCAEREPRFDIGFLSKQREEWVLVTRAREGSKLRGYSFSTLERIGGTPSLLIGLAAVDRTSRAETVLRAIMGDKFRRALLAFPDEDVLVGTRLLGPEGFRAFAGLTDVVPGRGGRPHRRPDLRRIRRRQRGRRLRFRQSQGTTRRGHCRLLRKRRGGVGWPAGDVRLGHGRGPGRRKTGWALTIHGGMRARAPQPERDGISPAARSKAIAWAREGFDPR
jgi:hypothetical protein